MNSYYRCKTSLSYEGVVPRGAQCPSCSSDVHVCVNCRFHDRSAHNQCREPAAEFVRDKERANFCELFELARSGGASKAGDAKAALDALFGASDPKKTEN